MGMAVDAAVSAEVCLDSCSNGVVSVLFRIENRGAAIMRDGIGYGFWTQDQNGEMRQLSQHYTSLSLLPGEGTDSQWVNFSTADLGAEGLFVIVDDEQGVGSLLECDESNNTLHLPQATCSM